MSYSKPPPATISDRIRNMKPQSDILVRGGNINSIRSLLVRVHNEGKGGAGYTCAAEGNNVRIWRLA